MESYSTEASESQEKNQASFETYKKIDVLGKGSFGKAFLVQCGSDGVCQF